MRFKIGIDLFSESVRAYEKDNVDKAVIIIDKSLIERLRKWCRKNNCDIDIEKFIEQNLDCIRA